MSNYLRPFDGAALARLVAVRSGEYKLGQKIGLLSDSLSLDNAVGQGYRFGLVGIPEDIGPRANHGKGGAHQGWSAFLTYFVNFQANRFLTGDDILLVGEVQCDDLRGDNIDQLRLACDELDKRVNNVIKQVFTAGLIPIVIGGGHNNAFPILQSAYQYYGQSLAVANLDPHSDFRQPEGRHSGNPFRYAQLHGALQRYVTVGLHLQKNSEEALAAMEQLGFRWHAIQSWHWQKQQSLTEVMDKVCDYILDAQAPIGIELDMDALSDMPSSALSHCGVSAEDALYYIHRMASLSPVAYLHLAEGAPQHHPAGEQAGRQVVGQTLAECVAAFIRSYNA